MKIKVLVVDDEALARKRILRLLKSERDADILGQVDNGKEAVESIRRDRPDLVFLDVQMPELDGFEVLASVGADEMPAVIFVTAFDQYAVRAFEVHAVDYLLKPFDADRFREAFRRARAHIGRGAASDQSERLVALLEHLGVEHNGLGPLVGRAGAKHLDRVMIKSGGRVFFVKVTDIDWIEAAGNYVRLHVGREAHLLRETITAMESKLDPDQFLRVHRSTIVNLDRIKEMQPWFSGDYVVILRDGSQLKLSRGYRDRLAERMGKAL